MSYHVRLPNRRALRKEDQHQHRRMKENEALNPDLQWTFIGTKRVSNSESMDEEDDSGLHENGDYVSVVQKDEAAFMYLPRLNEPLVTYSTRAPNYPIGYSCAHTLVHSSNGIKGIDSSPHDPMNLSHSEDGESMVLSETFVPIPLEFFIPASLSGDYDKIYSNVEALQWSILNEVAKRSGLAKGCKVNVQFDDRPLLTALTSLNELHSSATPETTLRHNSDQHTTLSVSSNARSSSQNQGKNQGNGQRNRRRARTIGTNRRMLSRLPYPMSVYSIESTRPQWTESCSSEMIHSDESESQCFTAEITLEVRFRGTTGESNLIEEYIQSIVHNQIALDASQLFVEDIFGLKWSSVQEASSLTQPPSNSSQESNGPISFGPENVEDSSDSIGTTAKDKSNSLFASIIIPIATACIVFVVWYCTRRYYNRDRKRARGARDHQEKSQAVVRGMKQSTDIEIGIVRTETTQSSHDQLSKSSSNSNGNPEDVISATASSDTISSSSSSTSLKSISATSDFSDRSITGLPPRPNVVKREGSKQLKKPRKKKKRRKKKVMSLQRINSRDNISEMPMISESESECDSESGGEDEDYSQDDDGSSYDASGGCLTPSRRSRTSSRASSASSVSSPPKSPRDDFFQPESATGDQSSYEFVMEAPEFSEDLFAGLKTKNMFNINANNSNPHTSIETPQSKMTVPETDKMDKHNQQTNILDSVSIGDDIDNDNFEIETGAELDTSFTNEHGSVMERMMPLPWLTGSGRNQRMK